MSLMENILVNVLAALAIAVMLGICLRSRPGAATGSGRQVYRIHGGWFVFSALGGALFVGIFALAGATGAPEGREGAVWLSVASVIAFLLFAQFLRTLSVTVDDETVTSHVLWIDQSVALRDIERVSIIGLVVELRLKAGAAAGQRPRALTFLAAFRGLNDLVATIRARAEAAGGLTPGN